LYTIGNISESDSSDDDNDMKQSPSLPTSETQQDASTYPNLTMNEASSKPRDHKHSKKRLKTSHTTSTDAAALQLSEDEL
jgi:hypothetical protein